MHILPRRWRAVLLVVAALLTGCANQQAAAPSNQAPVPATAPVTAPSVVPSAAPAAAAPTAAATPAAATYQNPVLRADFADPALLQVADVYYAYATNAVGKNVQVARSTDLITWTLLPDALPALPAWAKPGGSLVWAPEVATIGERYVLYYTARDRASNRQCIGVATSADPAGRFQDTNAAPLVCQADEGGSIDASPFRDGDTWYLYWKNDGNCCNKPTYLYVQQLTADGLGLVGAPTRLVRNDALWEGNLVEAPTMVKHAGAYLLFFSANDYASPAYAVGYATCQSAVGPCEDAPSNPVLKSRMDAQPLVVGPGHQTLIQRGDQTWIVYHAWEIGGNGLRTNRRFMYIDRVAWRDGAPQIVGPTTDPQPRP